jgi:hypothetical protein
MIALYQVVIWRFLRTSFMRLLAKLQAHPTISPISQSRLVIPAAIVGVVRSVLWKQNCNTSRRAQLNVCGFLVSLKRILIPSMSVRPMLSGKI